MKMSVHLMQVKLKLSSTCERSKKDEPRYQRTGQYLRAMFAVASYEGSHIWELLRADTADEEVC